MSGPNWSDLGPRVVSGIVLAGAGIAAIVFGGIAFSLFVAVCCGFMLWELGQMSGRFPLLAYPLALIGAFEIFYGFTDAYFSLLIVALLPAAFALTATKERVRVFIFAAMIGVTGVVLQVLRIELGVEWILWLVSVVVVTDIAGYFAGRLIGGPKFWPRLSPKKTWAGTSAGWLAAGVVGALFDVAYHGSFVLFSVLVAFASQMGDLAESALKRKFEIKDSSNLIPGHGGFLDRFDGMIAAALLIGVVSLFLPSGLGLFEMGDW